MLKRTGSKQMKMSFVILEELMPQKHFLRDLDKLINFDFIYDKLADLYSSTGRPSIDPVVMIKMLLIGYIYGIDSERKLEQEITVNIAYRWFLGIDFDERVPDHFTISKLKHRKFDGTSVFRDAFDMLVRKCIEVGLIDGKLLLTDSTHIKANAHIRELSKSGQYQAKKLEHQKSSVRAKVEHVFAMVKKIFHYRKTRHRGLEKQAKKINMMFALANFIWLTEKFFWPN